MQPSTTKVPARSSHGHGTGASGLRSRPVAAAAVFAVTLTMLLGVALPAVAAPEPTPSPDAERTAEATAIVPTITSPVDGALLRTSSARFTGTAATGSTVRIPGVTGCEKVAVVPSDDADEAGTWSCNGTGLRDGPELEVAPVQTLGGTATPADPITISVISAPTMETDADGTVLTTGVLSGTGYPGAVIMLGIGATATACPSPVSAEGYWSCTMNDVDSGTYRVSVAQSFDGKRYSNPSPEVRVTVDNEPGPAPTLTQPIDGHRVNSPVVTFAGTGATNARIDVYVSGRIVCSTTVADGAWTCAARGLPNGRHGVRVSQTDAAGHVIVPTWEIVVFFGPKPAAPQPPAEKPRETATPTPSPSATTPTPVLPPDWPPVVPEPGSAPPSLEQALTNWGTPTGFGDRLPPASAMVSGGNWLLGALGAVGFILLVALPLRMLTGIAHGRFRMPRLQLTGRNRTRLVPEGGAATSVNPWVAGLVPLTAVAALVVFSGGLGGEVRFLRLGFAVGVGLAILNLVGIVIASKVAAAAQGISGRLRFVPALLIAAAVAAVLSRVTQLQPPLLIGVIIAATFAVDLPVLQRARVALAQLGTLTALATASWLLRDRIGPVEGFWGSIPSEVLATVCLAGFGAVLVLVLPVRGFPGHTILEWSPPAWVATVLVTGTPALAVLVGDPVHALALLIAAVAAAVFAALVLASWAWARYAQPVT